MTGGAAEGFVLATIAPMMAVVFTNPFDVARVRQSVYCVSKSFLNRSFSNKNKNNKANQFKLCQISASN